VFSFQSHPCRTSDPARTDGKYELSELLHAAGDDVTGLHRSYAGGSSAVYEIAGGEVDGARDGADDFRNGPDQVP
jgi:hypothetical protein